MNATQLAMTAVAGYLSWRSAVRAKHYDLRGKVVLVTGGSRGLGLVLARKLIEEGAVTTICARDGNEVARAIDDLSARGGSVVGRVADLADPEQAADLVRAVIARFGRLDVVVNNAGVIQVGPVESMNLTDFHEAMSNNFWSAVHVTQAVVPFMKQAGGGRLVNIASIGGKIGVPHLIPYCASKFALVGYSQGLRAELAKDGIVVTTVCPGLMRTGSHGQALFKGNHRAEYAAFSISGSLPLATISAEAAAEQIVAACRRGDAEVILTVVARLASMVNQLAPSATAALLAAVNSFVLPRGNNSMAPPVRGFDSHSALAPSLLTRLNENAARENNETPAVSQ